MNNGRPDRIGQVDRRTGETHIRLCLNLDGTGKIRIGDIEWTARTMHNQIRIEANTIVKILRIEGVKMIVEKGE